jgi:predicted nuclease of restriction endonuclease-like RecB superfamily
MPDNYKVQLTITIYLAHLNPVTKAHVEIINELKNNDEVRVFPVIFKIDGKEINSKSFPFSYELRKKMLQAVFDDTISIMPNYTFYAPFAKYMPPLVSPYSWNIKRQILDGIKTDYFTYTGDKAEAFVLRLYGLNPKVGKRKETSASSVKQKLFEAAEGKNSDWEIYVEPEVVKIIEDNWDVVKKFANSPDLTYRVLGMKFPSTGFW